MLRATIEIVPYGDENRKRSLYVIEIGNDGTGNIDTGNYDVILYECDIDGRREEYPCGTTRVKGYKRGRQALELVREVLTKLHEERQPMKHIDDIEHVKCMKCGWVHFVDETAGTNALWHCFRCGVEGKENFMEAKEGDCPRGSTIRPVNW